MNKDEAFVSCKRKKGVKQVEYQCEKIKNARLKNEDYLNYKGNIVKSKEHGFHCRCVTCGEYIYKGKKFNARKEDVEGEDYLGIRIYRFYIKCTRCLQEISFKTDPRNTDYEIEAGATRNFMALKLAEEQAQREEDERKEDEATNPMKLLENRTKQSKQELELLESLEELRDLNRRQRLIDYDSMLSQYDGAEASRRLELAQQAEDEKYIRSVFGAKDSKTKIVEEEIIEMNEEKTRSSASVGSQNHGEPPPKVAKMSSHSTPSTFAAEKTVQVGTTTTARASSVGVLSSKSSLAGLVRVKQSAPTKLAPTKPASSTLSLLGAYSDSDGDGD